jgi:hypothetical protein
MLKWPIACHSSGVCNAQLFSLRGQRFLRRIYRASTSIQSRGIEIEGTWFRAIEGPGKRNKLKKTVKRKLRGLGGRQGILLPKSTATRLIVRGVKERAAPMTEVEGSIKRLDTAFPKDHAWKIYCGLNKAKTWAISQLRTGMNHLNEYLARIGATEDAGCGCGAAREMIKHFLFSCRW